MFYHCIQSSSKPFDLPPPPLSSIYRSKSFRPRKASSVYHDKTPSTRTSRSPYTMIDFYKAYFCGPTPKSNKGATNRQEDNRLFRCRINICVCAAVVVMVVMYFILFVRAYYYFFIPLRRQHSNKEKRILYCVKYII